MTAILAQLSPRDPVADARVTVRACSVQDRRVAGLTNGPWFPAMSAPPVQTVVLFDGDFSSDVQPGSVSFTLELDKIRDANIRRYLWSGAPVILYSGTPGDAWPWTQSFAGKVARWEASGNYLKLTVDVDTSPFEADVLTSTYAGTGGAEGDANLKLKPKPWLFGRATNVEPVLIDAVNSVYQFSAYGPIQAVTTLFERGSAFGAAVGDYATYAALVAATIPAGRWGTCLAAGMIRLGAPAYGVITADLDGHVESGAFLRLTGAIISCIATKAGVSAGLIDSVSLAALDTAIAALCPAGGNVNLYLTDQDKVIEVARRMALPCNAQAGVSWLGKLFAVRVAVGAAAITLDGQGKRSPQVFQSVEVDVSVPYWRIVMGGQRVWRVHTYDEIATYARLVNLGPYAAGTTYREGNMVQDQGSSWLYVNGTAGAGNAPPTLPTTSNAFWQIMASQGSNIAAVTLYQRTATYSAPAVPSVTTTLTFATGVLAGINNGWSQTDPGEAAGAYLWQIGATANSTGTTDTIATGEWSTPRLTAHVTVNPQILTFEEKNQQLIAAAAELGARYAALLLRATALGISATAATTARTSFLALLTSLSVAWNDATQDSSLAVNLGGVFPSSWVATAGVAAHGIYSTLTDNSATVFQNLSKTLTVTASASYVFGVVVVKDAVAAATRYPAIRLATQNGTSKSAELSFDSSTGAVIAMSADAIAGGCYALNDTEFYVWVAITLAADNTALSAFIYPARGITATANVAAQGSIDTRDPAYVLGSTFDKLGRDALRYRQKDYGAQLDALDKAISESDGVTSLQISGALAATINATPAGDASASLPFDIGYTATVGSSSVTGAATWAMTVLSAAGSITCTMGAATGTLSITALATTLAQVLISCTYGGVTKTAVLTVTRSDALPSSGGGTSASAATSTFASVNSTTWTTIATLVITAGSAGPVLSAPSLSCVPRLSDGIGSANIEMKWVRENGVTDVDVGSTANSSPDPEVASDGDGHNVKLFGSISCPATDSGRSVGVAYTYYLMARNTSGARACTFTGTASVTS